MVHDPAIEILALQRLDMLEEIPHLRNGGGLGYQPAVRIGKAEDDLPPAVPMDGDGAQVALVVSDEIARPLPNLHGAQYMLCRPRADNPGRSDNRTDPE